ncbi:hypothetical protein BaRGS_00002751, partial [Batillaria attramentaria]
MGEHLMPRHMMSGASPGGPQDLRKERHEPLPDPRVGMAYPRPRSGDLRDPRDQHDPRDMREGCDPRGLPGREYEVQDLSRRQPEIIDKGPHGYKGNPHDFDPTRGRTYDMYARGGPDGGPQHRPMAAPPPAHSHHTSSSVGQAPRRPDSRNKSPSMYPVDPGLAQGMRGPGNPGLPPSGSPFTGMDPGARHSPASRIPPPPPLITSGGPKTSPKLSRSPPSSSSMPPHGHMMVPPGSITHGTPVTHAGPIPPGGHATTIASMVRRMDTLAHQSNTPPTSQPSSARMEGSITKGTPMNREGPMTGRGGPGEGGRMVMDPTFQGRGGHMYEAGYAPPPGAYYERQGPGGVEVGKAGPPQPSGGPGAPGGPYYPYQAAAAYSGDQGATPYSSRATIMNDFFTAKQMPRRKDTEREELSPRGREIAPVPPPRGMDPRMPHPGAMPTSSAQMLHPHMQQGRPPPGMGGDSGMHGKMSPHIPPSSREDKPGGHPAHWPGPRGMAPQQPPQPQQQHPHSMAMDPHHGRPSIVMGTGRPTHPMEVKVDQPDSTTLQRGPTSPRQPMLGVPHSADQSRMRLSPSMHPHQHPHPGMYRPDMAEARQERDRERERVAQERAMQERAAQQASRAAWEHHQQQQQQQQMARRAHEQRAAELEQQVSKEGEPEIRRGPPTSESGGYMSGRPDSRTDHRPSSTSASSYLGDRDAGRGGGDPQQSSDPNSQQRQITDRSYMQKLANEHAGNAVILAAFQKDQPSPQSKTTSSASQVTAAARSLTAATLIDAIIIHQINRTTPDNGGPITSTSIPSSMSGSGGSVVSTTASSSSNSNAGKPSGSPSPSPGRMSVPERSRTPNRPPESSSPAHVDSRCSTPSKYKPARRYYGRGGSNGGDMPPDPSSSPASSTGPQGPGGSSGTGGGSGPQSYSGPSGLDPPHSSGPAGNESGSNSSTDSTGSLSTRMITLGDHIDAIIIKDYNNRTMPGKDGEPKGMGSLLSQIQSTSTPSSSGKTTPTHQAASEVSSQMGMTTQMMRRSPWDSAVGSSSDSHRPRSFSGSTHGPGGPAQHVPQPHHDPHNWRKRVQQQALSSYGGQAGLNHPSQPPPHGHPHPQQAQSSAHSGQELDTLRVPSEQPGVAGRATPDQLRARSPQAAPAP